MKTITSLSSLADFQNALKELKDVTGRPKWIYNAYKEHLAFNKMKELESISISLFSYEKNAIEKLLIEFKSEHQKLINKK